MKWCRAVWNEKGKEIEDTIPNKWVIGNKVKFPLGNWIREMRNETDPKDDWAEYPLIKIKIRSGKFWLHLFVLAF